MWSSRSWAALAHMDRAQQRVSTVPCCPNGNKRSEYCKGSHFAGSRLLEGDPYGRVVGSSIRKGRQQRGGGGLVEPRETSRAPRNKVVVRSYSDLDKESVGLELARMVLSSERDDIVDLRTQCGVGADAMDQLKRFYELKVSAGDEPNSITLTNAELQRARSSPYFFLVVVSRVEGADARPTVRIIPQPLDQLEQSVNGTMALSGVRGMIGRRISYADLTAS